LEFLFKEEEKEVLATAALAEPPPPKPKQLLSTIKLLAVRMTTLFFPRSVRCARACVRRLIIRNGSRRFVFWPHTLKNKKTHEKKVEKKK
jgi:hypothetical protein